MFGPVAVLLAAGAIVFTFVVFNKRCRKGWKAKTAAVVTIAIMAFLRFVPGIWWLAIPALLLRVILHSSVACYIGAVLQFGVAAWFLGWFHRPKLHNEIHDA
jgi:hypothetical protein